MRLGLTVSGMVQGVGFRPFLFRLAAELTLGGLVRNTAQGVYVEIEGAPEAVRSFQKRLKAEAPPLSSVETVKTACLPDTGARDFVILPSGGGAHSALISPDVAMCESCRRELWDPGDRRYRYPFLNCTDCGPRFTILRDIPYDRVNTTVSGFPLCPACTREYHDPANRRFHAQPTACPACGPQLRLTRGDGTSVPGDPLAGFAAGIKAGALVAVKGLGGFHLACDAEKEEAVRLLRARKQRYEKPFAVLLRDMETVRRYCRVSAAEEALLCSRRAPIVLLEKHGDLAPSVTPGSRRLGVMLPYTPLHSLVAAACPVLVLTSDNVSDRPMCYEDAAAYNGLADLVLTHDRPIYRRLDDSVAVVSGGRTRLLRRARGWTPEPLLLPGGDRTLLALGAQQKSTFCLVKGEHAFLSGHIGDLDDPAAEDQYRAELKSFQRLFEARPGLLICDKHPDYVSTRFGQEMGLPLRQVQHHRAHFAAVLAEHRCMEQDAVGLVFDGSGYGDDGLMWGGEAFLGGLRAMTHGGQLRPFDLPGGEAAVWEPWRCALSVLAQALSPAEAAAYFPRRQTEAVTLQKLPAPVRSTGMGRLFDAAAAICGLRETVHYQGQAAVELEQLADRQTDVAYRFALEWESGLLVFDWRQMVRDMVRDLRRGVAPSAVAMGFHLACAALPLQAAKTLGGGSTAALSGGCFMNEILYRRSRATLERAGYRVLTGQVVPVNDGGVSFGQAALAVYGEE